MKGWKTLSAAIGFIAVGLLQLTVTVDFRALLAPFIKDETQLGFAVVIAGIVFGVLRFVTSTPVGNSEDT